MPKLQHTKLLQNSKNLLAFSAGGDSTALFFLLLENGISFDIAIVDYGVREQSKDEVAYAKELAQTYNLKCYLHSSPNITRNFEAKAREIRYSFFEDIIDKHNYNNLLTAHHLGDRFEWMLMQFCKGAGCVELAGMKAIQKRETYTLVRPLLHLDKQELLEYLNSNAKNYFEDETNQDTKYKRNEFRKHITTPLLSKYLDGIKQSFSYIDEDVAELIKTTDIKKINKLTYFKSTKHTRSDIYAIDKIIKNLGYILSRYEREQLKTEKTTIISREIVVTKEHDFVFVAPYIKSQNIQKDIKEKMRKLKIEPKLRGYLSSDLEVLEFISLLLA